MSSVQTWLEEKLAKGVTQVRVSSVLLRLAEAEKEQRRARRSAKLGANGRVTISADDLLGAAEVADLLRVDRARPSKWRNEKIQTTFGPDKIPFPEPFRQLKTGPIWLRSQIEPLIPFVEARRRQRS